MKCKCSLNNNYQTIGLCDLKIYNDEIIKFRDKSYSQFKFSEIISLPKNSQNISKILKLYMNINIHYTKIIDTPSSNLPNYEGINLTGKILLVHGNIEQTIIYTNDKEYNHKYSFKFNSNFNNYIMIDEKTEEYKDNYAIFPYIEDIHLIPLNNTTINENITLFLFARNVKIKPIQKFLTSFIFKTFNTDKEMARVEFDKNGEHLIVSSTGAIYNDGTDNVFSFELTNFLQTQIKAYGVILGNQDATNFKIALSNAPFRYGDLIRLRFKNNSKVYLSNYPKEGNKYNMLTKSTQGFIITPDGIAPYVLSNDILLNNFNDYPVVKVQFDILNKLFLVNSYQNRSNPGGINYFKMSLFEDDYKTLKVAVNIPGNSVGNDFKTKLFNQNFDYGNIIKLEYEDRNMVVVTNFPNPNTPSYNPKEKREFFQITEDGLRPFLENLKNKITIKSVKNEEVLSIEFNKIDEQFKVTSTKIIPDPSSKYEYCTLILKDEVSTTKLSTTLYSDENAENFKTLLNDISFEFENTRIILIYKNKASIEISNYPNIGRKYIPSLNASIFTISRHGLVDSSFDNKIFIFNDKNKEMATMQFVKTDTNPITVITSTNTISTDTLTNTQKYVELLDYSKDSLKFHANILGKKDATSFKDDFSDKTIVINSDVLRIANKFPNRVVVTNFANKAMFEVGIEPLFFETTKTNLKIHNLNYNKVRFKNIDNSTILFIFFDKLNSTIIYTEAYSTGKLNVNSDYFEFKILDKTETKTKFLVRAPKNDRAIFVDVGEVLFNISRDIRFGDVLEINCSEPNLVEISDVQNNIISTLPSTSQRYSIDESGLRPLPPKPVEKLLNTFIFETFDTDEEMAIVEFDKLNMKLIITSTGLDYDGLSRTQVFRFELLDAKHTTITATGRIRGDGNANEFRDELNGKIFEYNGLIKLIYDDSTKVTLTNYPNRGNIYNMQGENIEAFLITPNGIVPYILPNNIILNDVRNRPIFIMQFSLLNNHFFIKTTQNVTNPTGSQNYFKAILYNSDATTEKITATIPGNTNANQFASKFRNRVFQFGDILRLEYEEREKVIVNNFPTSSTPVYIPKINGESFTITRTGLQPYPPILPPGPELLPNVISFKNIDGEVMATISFDKINKKLIVTSTGINYGGVEDKPAFIFFIEGKVGIAIFDNSNADNFKNRFNNENFKFGDKLNLIYLKGDRVEITNFPNQSTPIYNPKGTEEKFTITENGLIMSE